MLRGLAFCGVGGCVSVVVGVVIGVVGGWAAVCFTWWLGCAAVVLVCCMYVYCWSLVVRRVRFVVYAVGMCVACLRCCCVWFV